MRIMRQSQKVAPKFAGMGKAAADIGLTCQLALQFVILMNADAAQEYRLPI